jgi:transposase
MGIDELHIIKKPRGVITNIEKKTIVDLLENRNKETLSRYFVSLPNKERIELITMDMWRPYKDAVHVYLPQAFVVVDKFHITSMANIAMETIRKRLRASLV